MTESTTSRREPKERDASKTPLMEKLAAYLEEERVYRFPYFTAAVAFDLGLALRAKHIAWSASHGPLNPVVISVSTFSGAVLFQCVAGGDPPDAADLGAWATAKKNTVRRFGHSSAFVECRLAASGRSLADAGLLWPDYAVVGGAFPIYLRNAPIAPLGSITVAGLAHDTDHRLIVETLAEFIPNLFPPHVGRGVGTRVATPTATHEAQTPRTTTEQHGTGGFAVGERSARSAHSFFADDEERQESDEDSGADGSSVTSYHSGDDDRPSRSV